MAVQSCHETRKAYRAKSNGKINMPGETPAMAHPNAATFREEMRALARQREEPGSSDDDEAGTELKR